MNHDQQPRKRGAPFGNRNAIGNKGGAPFGNLNAEKHGLHTNLIYRLRFQRFVESCSAPLSREKLRQIAKQLK